MRKLWVFARSKMFALLGMAALVAGFGLSDSTADAHTRVASNTQGESGDACSTDADVQGTHTSREAPAELFSSCAGFLE